MTADKVIEKIQGSKCFAQLAKNGRAVTLWIENESTYA